MQRVVSSSDPQWTQSDHTPRKRNLRNTHSGVSSADGLSDIALSESGSPTAGAHANGHVSPAGLPLAGTLCFTCICVPQTVHGVMGTLVAITRISAGCSHACRYYIYFHILIQFPDPFTFCFPAAPKSCGALILLERPEYHWGGVQQCILLQMWRWGSGGTAPRMWSGALWSLRLAALWSCARSPCGSSSCPPSPLAWVSSTHSMYALLLPLFVYLLSKCEIPPGQ